MRDDGAFAIPWQIFQDRFDAGGGELFVVFDRTRRFVTDSRLGPVEAVLRASDVQQFQFRR